MKKIAIDFDDTLSTHEVQRLASKLIKDGHDVHIVTSRVCNKLSQNPSWNDDLFFTAEVLSIPMENIHFCNLSPKWKFFRDNDDFDFHIDDDPEEVDEINKNCKTKAIFFVSVFDNSGIKEIEKEIEKKKKHKTHRKRKQWIS